MTEQENFWRGSFGSEYTLRNRIEWEKRRPFWREILKMTGARSILEVGCNAGWNLMALRAEDPTLKLRGTDINRDAIAEARANLLDVREVPAASVGEFWPERFDLVFSAGVLIHVPPLALAATMLSIRRASSKYVLAVEYPWYEEREIVYRGHQERLWKRPYGEFYESVANMIMKRIGNLHAEDGFDDSRFWLMQKYL